jgi:hypothetical protein
LKRILLVAALVANTAMAQDAQTIEGAWTGRIGNSAINACFSKSDGQYFYQRQLEGIQLSAPEEKDDSWREPDGTWKISRVTEFELEGVWLGDGKRLTIRLTRLGPLRDGECGAAYYEPVVNGIKYEFSDAHVGALPLRLVKSPLGQSFELKGTSPAIRQINFFSRRWRESQAINAFSCKLNGGEVGESELTAGSVIGHYLLVQENEPDNFCGGPHGNSAHATYLFDLRTGQKVNTYAWLANGEASLVEPAEGKPKPPLRKLLEKLNQRDDCEGMSYDVRAPFPTAKGLAFSTSYPQAGHACNEDIEVSYARLAPFLSAEGKAFVKNLKH